MSTLKEKIINFIANYFIRLYLTKHKTKSKIRKLRNEIPLSLVKDIEEETTTHTYVKTDNELLYLCIIYFIAILSLTILLFIFAIWVSY